MSIEATPVEIVGEPAYRVILERNVSNEIIVVRREIEAATWPEDERSQRMWALTIASQRWNISVKDDDAENLLTKAEQIRAYVNGAAP